MSLNFKELEQAVLEKVNSVTEMELEELTNYFSSVGVLLALYQTQTLKYSQLFDQTVKLLSDKSQQAAKEEENDKIM